MEFWQSDPDELSPPPPPPPPPTWLQRSVSDQPPLLPKPLTEMELRQLSHDQTSYGDLIEQLARGNKSFNGGILLEKREAITESQRMDIASLEANVKEATEQKEENNIQDGTAATSVKAVWRATLSQTGRVLKTVKGILNILTPEKLDILKDQPIASGITPADILKDESIQKDESIPIPPTGNIITCSTLRGDGSVLQSADSVAKSPSLKHRYGLGDDYINQGIGYNVEYIGQGIGRENDNYEMLNKVHPKIERGSEKETRNRGNEFDSVRVPVEPWEKSLEQEVGGLSLEDNIAMSVEEKLRIQGRTETSGMDMFPFQQTSLESKVDETVLEKEKNIFLAKPSADLSATEKEGLVVSKESACTVFNAWGIGNIDGKKLWICFICQVTATSEADLKHHFTGNKHRSKRAALQAENSAAITGEAVQISQIEPLMPTLPPIATTKPLLPKNKNKAKCKENFAFWCKMCHAGANNKHLMEAHKRGNKHLSQFKKKCPFWCDLCNVGADRAHIMKAHLKGKRHLTMLQEKAASTTAEQGNSPLKIV